MSYIIVGDTEKYGECLVWVLGSQTRERAEEVLQRILSNPRDDEKRDIERHTNLRVKEVKSEDCWWNQGGLD